MGLSVPLHLICHNEDMCPIGGCGGNAEEVYSTSSVVHANVGTRIGAMHACLTRGHTVWLAASWDESLPIGATLPGRAQNAHQKIMLLRC